MSARDAIWSAIYDNHSPADQFEAVLAAVAASEREVWVLDVSVEGPEAGDYDGWQSVHASRDGALGGLIDKLAEHGVDLGADVETVASAAADNGSLAGDFAVGDLAVSYGVHLMPVEP
ncbi:hypothetical protein MURUCUTUMBU_37 [Mycobacterium phage Murucutumbu]|uniref:Uncharacterized protein n=2 Tax=Anayavirus TaxID=2946797 RepID=A0A222ZR90_9CAUD|nr:hypothetical protein AVV71_gp64 [Mycobacterium phage Murucutumbu]YP_009953233.1 hypothetical protein I5G99_gp069 [Mycobacterium phage LastHope]AIW03024.1 hypothetical protein MURUCUTUMBU_37 [Mycobacterium phage Murucutumbu]ASR87207.1 hypothetical protein SEA_LASTHOPE_39 [Mycobacterium phage LastHope]